MEESSIPTSEPPEHAPRDIVDHQGADESARCGSDRARADSSRAITRARSSRDIVEVAIHDQQRSMTPNTSQLVSAVQSVVWGEAACPASISVAIVDDRVSRELNKTYLQHDYTTDCLSFILERNEEWLDGEIVVNAAVAARRAAEYGWSADAELLLYVVHSALHLVGFDDATPPGTREMRTLERKYLGRFGLTPRFDGTENYHVPREIAK